MRLIFLRYIVRLVWWTKKTKGMAYKYCLDICFNVEWYFNTLRRGDTYTSTSIRSVVIRIGLFASPLPSKYLNKYWIINFVLINKLQLYFNQRVKYRTIRSTRRDYCLPFSLNLNELTWNVKGSVLYLPSCICVTSTKNRSLVDITTSCYIYHADMEFDTDGCYSLLMFAISSGSPWKYTERHYPSLGGNTMEENENIWRH